MDDRVSWRPNKLSRAQGSRVILVQPCQPRPRIKAPRHPIVQHSSSTSSSSSYTGIPRHLHHLPFLPSLFLTPLESPLPLFLSLRFSSRHILHPSFTMVNADEILSIVALACFAILLVQFVLRYLRSGWGLYVYISFFCVIRVVAYGIRAYLDGGPDVSDSTLSNLTTIELICISIGAIFAFKLIARLYESILPKLRDQAQVGPDLFERTMVQQNKLFLLPLVILVIVGAVDSTPSHTPSQMSTGLTLRRIGVSLLMIMGIWYLHQGLVYRQRYSANRRAFNIALLTTVIFDLSLVYKVIYSFWPKAETVTIIYFLFSPLLELIALAVLSVDLQAYFLGHVVVQEDIEVQPVLVPGQPGYFQPTPAPGYQPQPPPQQQMYQPQYSSAQY